MKIFSKKKLKLWLEDDVEYLNDNKRIIFHIIKSEIFIRFIIQQSNISHNPVIKPFIRNTWYFKKCFSKIGTKAFSTSGVKRCDWFEIGNPLAVIFSNTIYRSIYLPIMTFNFDNPITRRSARQSARSPKENFCSPNIVNWLIVFHGCWLHPRKA